MTISASYGTWNRGLKSELRGRHEIHNREAENRGWTAQDQPYAHSIVYMSSLQVQSMIHMRIPNRPLVHTYILSWTVIAPYEHACVHAQSGIRPLMYVPVHIIQTKYQNSSLEVQQEHYSGLVQMKNALLCRW